eukprot:GCRY01003844.1.p1 GENE.GCRY01003844.1~~GCRY01003844.1.p1  ORF type:complete len:240 (+),score=44.21 GCRY01003844.1:191-910(+)
MSTTSAFEEIIHLNVGGKLFSTTISTLRSEKNTMLDAMFSGRMPLRKDENGRYFIDRNGKWFSYVLDYLRDLNSFIVPADGELRRILAREADYFQLEGLSSLLHAKNSEDPKDSYAKRLLNNRTGPSYDQVVNDYVERCVRAIERSSESLAEVSVTFEGHEPHNIQAFVVGMRVVKSLREDYGFKNVRYHRNQNIIKINLMEEHECHAYGENRTEDIYQLLRSCCGDYSGTRRWYKPLN